MLLYFVLCLMKMYVYQRSYSLMTATTVLSLDARVSNMVCKQVNFLAVFDIPPDTNLAMNQALAFMTLLAQRRLLLNWKLTHPQHTRDEDALKLKCSDSRFQALPNHSRIHGIFFPEPTNSL